ncbi:DUF4192 domain-containing protein [Pedococcus sp. KACC 23699]|uniref:DUF4192 domain-containing protein n=1 Tax=Pedococcus sp. KACC 23699 TaxID=3149228 RepID=A0AAU7JRM0_9MICO
MEPIRLAGPADVLAVLPYQLGYHPSDSLVAVVLRDRQVGLVERIDLPPDDAVEEACAAAVEPLLREAPDSVLLVGYESHPGAALPLADAVRDRMLAAGIVVLDRLVVRDGRWYAPDCETGCCPSRGDEQVIPRDSPAVAPFVALEVAPLPGRQSLAELVSADPELTAPVAAALDRLAVRTDRLIGVAVQGQGVDAIAGEAQGSGPGERVVAVHRLRYLATWATVLEVSDTSDDSDGHGRDGNGGQGPVWGAEQVALLVASLRDVQLRDALIAWICPGTLPLDALSPDLVDALHSCLPDPAWVGHQGDEVAVVAGRRVVTRLQSVVRAVPDEQAAALLTVLANLAWWLGDGALTRVALDRALEHSPGYRLARLLERMVDLGVRPRSPRSELTA